MIWNGLSSHGSLVSAVSHSIRRDTDTVVVLAARAPAVAHDDPRGEFENGVGAESDVLRAREVLRRNYLVRFWPTLLRVKGWAHKTSTRLGFGTALCHLEAWVLHHHHLQGIIRLEKKNLLLLSPTYFLFILFKLWFAPGQPTSVFDAFRQQRYLSWFRTRTKWFLQPPTINVDLCWSFSYAQMKILCTTWLLREFDRQGQLWSRFESSLPTNKNVIVATLATVALTE